MNMLNIITVVSLVMAVSNGIAMILMYHRYVQVVRGAFATLRATESGEVEMIDLLSDNLLPFIR